jgi:two-component system, chemotaxis family, CheB/CheR fusion protein
MPAPLEGVRPESSDNSRPGGPQSPSFPVVAIGASAGGLEAFTELLRGLPVDTGMAFVLIQHLSPDHESMLARLLSRETAMPVSEVEDGTVLAPNHVYVIPPNAAITISGLALAVKPRDAAGTAVDGFLRSLAESRKSAAVAVVLSGTGSDGALGVQAVGGEGGVVFAQDPTSARFDGMPRSAIATGCVDLVLPPEGIAAELARIAREPHLLKRDILDSERTSDSADGIQTLLDLLRVYTGIDFSLYRQTTIRRRLLRRMALLKQGSLGRYLEYVKENPDELHALAQDALIRVTRFFRDAEAFEAVSRRVFPTLIRKTPVERYVRIWVPGCSTGEEAYSLAICFLEVAEQMRSGVSVQVFATDINEAAIEKARRGVYIENIAADVSAERLQRFFTRVGTEFQVGRRVRDLCVFSRHDVLTDPAFSRMDLVSCRNVLIYLDSVHEQALSRFHFALNPGGFLLLGRSESTASYPELFAPFDKEARIYVRQEPAGYPPQVRAKRKASIAAPWVALSPVAQPPRRVDIRQEVDRIVIEKHGPPRVVVNRNLEFSPEAGEPHSPDRKLLHAIRKDHGEALRNAILKAGKTGHSVRIEKLNLADGASPREVSLDITPLGTDRHEFLIMFEDQGQPVPDLKGPGAPTSNERRSFEKRIGSLERELAGARAHMDSGAVEQEAANEEVVAANEELNSLNEELEGSKEELEATNEELTTVNQELQVRNTELENAREFAQATIDTVRSALLVLGPNLRVLKANQSFYRTFRMSPVDVEQRFVYELGDGDWRVPTLRQLLEEVLPQNKTIREFEMEYHIPSAGRRVLLLNAHRFEGEDRILLSIEDVTESKRAEEEQRQAQKMEAIGYLASGVAHDFNNLLTGIIGNVSLVLDAMPEDDTARPALDTVLSGGQRAAELTRQLLAYAGKGRFYLEWLNLSEVVIETSRLVRPSIPAKVQIKLDLDRDLPLFLADAGQIQQVVMNLVINGAESIGADGGAVRVRTGRKTVTNEGLPGLYLDDQLAPGAYVFLEVVDNGSGMDEQTIRKIFDPFFTTKFTGRGLGLAAALGIVRQHKGGLQLHSVPGRGTSFTVLFPAAGKEPSQPAETASHDDLRGAGTVLVVDDEEVIRNFCKSALESHGYTVLQASNGQEAVRLFRERSSEIALVLLDVAMPGMDGIEALEWIRGIRPDITVLVCSGFGEVDLENRFAGKKIAGFFQKPYTVKQLVGKVKELLSTGAGD